jgi:hypothetical protein
MHEVDLNVNERTAGFACGTFGAELETPSARRSSRTTCRAGSWTSSASESCRRSPRPASSSGSGASGTIDHILVRCGEHGGPTLRITACERIFEEPIGGVWAGDHFGVVADLSLPA